MKKFAVQGLELDDGRTLEIEIDESGLIVRIYPREDERPCPFNVVILQTDDDDTISVSIHAEDGIKTSKIFTKSN